MGNEERLNRHGNIDDSYRPTYEDNAPNDNQSFNNEQQIDDAYLENQETSDSLASDDNAPDSTSTESLINAEHQSGSFLARFKYFLNKINDWLEQRRKFKSILIMMMPVFLALFIYLLMNIRAIFSIPMIFVEKNIDKMQGQVAPVLDLNFASEALSLAKNDISKVNGIILTYYPDYLRLSQQIISLRQTYTPIFKKINAGTLPEPLIYQRFVTQLEKITQVCAYLSKQQLHRTSAQKVNFAQLQAVLVTYRQAVKALNNYDPTIQLSHYENNDQGQLQRILASNIAEQINIFDNFYMLAQQLSSSLQVYIEQEKTLLLLMQDYNQVLSLSIDTLSIQYKAIIINESTATVYQLYQRIEALATQQKLIRQQHKQLQQGFLAQRELL